MFYAGCFNVLKSIANDVPGVKFSNDMRLKELFEMTVAGDNNRLENAEGRYKDTLMRHNNLKAEEEKQRRLLSKVKDDLHDLDNKCERLKNQKDAPTTKMTDDAISKLHNEVQQLLNIFKMYKNFTGVRFEFRSYPDAVVGYVAVKGSIPSKSVLRPFCVKKPFATVVEEIWAEVTMAAENAS